MADGERRLQRHLYQVGAALAVTALVPIGDLIPSNAAPSERLAALRGAAQSGCIELLCPDQASRDQFETGRHVAQFDKTTTTEMPKPPP